MEYVYLLTEHEKSLIDNDRRLKAFYQERLEQRKSCQHNWRYDGHSHNDDCYICTICGETDYR